MSPSAVLKKYWGYSSFRLSQQAVVDSILSGRDTLALLPTGGGKSVCYQVPGLLFPGITLVITPLISLMKDQVDNLQQRNITATYLASTLEKPEQEKRYTLLQAGHYKFVYISPEKLISSTFIQTIKTLHISQVVVDESHCIALWGGEFRPSYLKIASVISQLSPRPVVAALTATATLATKREIVASLQLEDPQIFQSSFKRDIAICVLTTTSETMHELQLLAALKNKNKPGIIYTSSRKETERLSHKLNQLSRLLNIGEVSCYHAGLSADSRQEVQQKFIENKCQLLVATTAFGMGIDKPDISFVIHYHPPANLEGYYQEIGRAGRGGEHSDALLLFNPAHLAIHQGLLAHTTDAKPKKMFEQVKGFLSSDSCRMQNILHYFGEKSENCGVCDLCISQPSALEKIITSKTRQIQTLQRTRDQLADTFQVSPRIILSDSHLAYWLILQPTAANDLPLIPGIGQGWIQLWAKYLISKE